MKKFRTINDAVQASDHIIAAVLAAGVAKTYTVPSDAAIVLLSGSVDFRAAFIGADESLDLVTNGTMAADTGWTKGTGWTIAAGVASSDGTQAGNADLEQTPTGSAAVVEGRAYLVTFTVSGRAGGTVRAVLGGTAGASRSTDATFAEVLRAGADGKLLLRADLDFVGNVDTVKVEPVAAIPATDNTTGKAHAVNPTSAIVSGVRAISLVSAAICEVTMEFFAS